MVSHFARNPETGVRVPGECTEGPRPGEIMIARWHGVRDFDRWFDSFNASDDMFAGSGVRKSAVLRGPPDSQSTDPEEDADEYFSCRATVVHLHFCDRDDLDKALAVPLLSLDHADFAGQVARGEIILPAGLMYGEIMEHRAR